MPGFGSQPFGSSPYGVGTPAVAPDGGGSLLRDATTGQTQGSRSINPFTRDYALNSTTGRVDGMGNTKQLVLLAVSTDQGTAAMRQLGQLLRKIDRISPNFERRVDSALRDAVQHLVNSNLIEVVGTEVEVLRPGVAFARLKWRDLDTGLEDETLVAASGG